MPSSRSQDSEAYAEDPLAIFLSCDAYNCLTLLHIDMSLNDRSLIMIRAFQLLSLSFSVSEAQTNYVRIMQNCNLTNFCKLLKLYSFVNLLDLAKSR